MKFIVLCPFNFQKNILSEIRQNKEFLDVKFIDKEEIVSSYYGQFKHGSNLEIMKKFNCNYELANIYLSYLVYIDENAKYEDLKLIKLQEIKRYLLSLNDKQLFKKDEYFLNLIKNKKVYVVGYSPLDSVLNKILKNLNCEAEFIKHDLNKDEKLLHTYLNIEDEIHALMINICDLVNKENVSLKDIYLYGVNDDYIALLNRYSKMYHIPFNNLNNESILTYEFSKKFFKTYFTNHSVNETLKLIDEQYNQDPNYLIFKQEVESRIDDTLNFQQQYDVLLNSINSKCNVKIYDNAVTILDNLTHLNNKHIFILGFKQGVYPMVKNDNEYLTDELKAKVGLPKVIEINNINKSLLLDFLSSNNHFYYSFAEKTFSGLAYISFLKQTLNLNEVEGQISNYDYSKTASEIELLKMKDLKDKYGQIKENKKAYEESVDFIYKDYDNQFKPFKIYDENSDLTHAYSNIKTYISCPFQYYLSQVLKIDNDFSNFNITLGTCTHSVLEHGLRDLNADFETLFNTYFTSDKFDKKEILLLDGLKKAVEIALNTAREQWKYILTNDKKVDAKLFLEKKIYIPLGENIHSQLKGTIDKAILTSKVDENNKLNTFASLIDYKTGSEKFEPKLFQIGESLQLPTYGLLMRRSAQFKDCILGGFYINNVICSTLSSRYDDINQSNYLKWQGRALADIDYITTLEPDFLDQPGKYVNVKTSKKETYPASCFFKKEEFDEYVRMCEQYYIECDKQIRANNFKISPRRLKDDTSCKYCQFKDICYVKFEQFRKVELKDE